MNIEEEFDEALSEIDDILGEVVGIITNHGTRFSCRADVGQFVTGRELTASNTIRAVRTAHIIIYRATNAALEDALSSGKQPFIPNGWKCEVFGNKWPISGSRSDSVAWEFDVEDGAA